MKFNAVVFGVLLAGCGSTRVVPMPTVVEPSRVEAAGIPVAASPAYDASTGTVWAFAPDARGGTVVVCNYYGSPPCIRISPSVVADETALAEWRAQVKKHEVAGAKAR